MKQKTLNKILLILSQVFFGLFIILIILLFTVDRKEIGPNESIVGLSTINQAFFNKFNGNSTWESISKFLGYGALAIVGAMAVLGLMQWISRKKFLKVDVEIMLLGIFYIICLLIYVFFNNVTINYRPILVMNKLGEEVLELSFPSSHTILGLFVYVSLGLVLRRYIKNQYILIPVQILCFGLGLLMLIGRIFSGVHWFTDILGGALLTGFLLLMFELLLNINIESRKKEE